MRFILGDSEYYADRAVSHVAQGDVFEHVPIALAQLNGLGAKPQGARKRALFSAVTKRSDAHALIEYEAELAVVCNYTCGFVAQPPGQEGYSHDHRLVAPIVPLHALVKAGVTKNDARRIATYGHVNGILRVPAPGNWSPAGGWAGDEFDGHLAVCLWKMTAVTQDLLDARNRVARLSLDAQRMLANSLIQVVSPYLFDPEDEDLQDPDMSDSWKASAIGPKG